MIRIKPGVLLTPVAPAGLCLLAALKASSRALDLSLTITSGSDGEHSGPTDPHKLGEAYDVRSRDLAPDDKARVLQEVLGRAGSDFFGFLEDPGGPNEHFHFQRRKGIVFNVITWLTEA